MKLEKFSSNSTIMIFLTSVMFSTLTLLIRYPHLEYKCLQTIVSKKKVLLFNECNVLIDELCTIRTVLKAFILRTIVATIVHQHPFLKSLNHRALSLNNRQHLHTFDYISFHSHDLYLLSLN